LSDYGRHRRDGKFTALELARKGFTVVMCVRNAVSVVMIAMKCSLALGQSPVPAILEIDIENVVEYQSDISDPSDFGINPGSSRRGVLK